MAEGINTLVEKVQSAADVAAKGDTKGHSALVAAVNELKNAVDTPWDILWETRFESMNSLCKRMAMEMGLLKAITARQGNPITAEELAEQTGQDAQLISRILRVLTARNILTETGECSYAANEATMLLNSPGGIAAEKYFFDFLFPIGANIVNIINNGGIHQFPEGDQKGPFELTFGAPIFDYLKQNNEAKLVFDNLMSGRREGVGVKWYETYPAAQELFSQDYANGHTQEEVFLVDIAGGRGHDILSFATAHTNIPGRLILEDLPLTFANLEKERVSMLTEAGIELQPYDMFEPQPIHGARAYFMRDIMHDWPDSACKIFLGNVAKAMTKGYSTLLLDDHVVEDVNATHRSAASDVLMMLVLTGLERTRRQWKELLSSVGLEIVKIWPGAEGQQSVIEATLA